MATWQLVRRRSQTAQFLIQCRPFLTANQLFKMIWAKHAGLQGGLLAKHCILLKAVPHLVVQGQTLHR